MLKRIKLLKATFSMLNPFTKSIILAPSVAALIYFICHCLREEKYLALFIFSGIMFILSILSVILRVVISDFKDCYKLAKEMEEKI